ncbi:MAG: hypothetical protein IJ370_08395 [Oscillospiraceae bacterium]|nr:hypothetical protein [Oscillospiraceae bacterium]
MDELKSKNPLPDENEGVDIWQILLALWRKVWVIVIAGVVSAALFFGYTTFMVTPMYSSSVLLYVNSSSVTVGNGGVSISASGLSVARSLVETYIGILETRTTLEKVAKEAGVDYSYAQLKGMVNAETYGETEIFKVSVTTPDPRVSAKIANTIAEVLPDRVSEIIDGCSVRLVDKAVVSTAKTSPSVTRNTLLGFIFGAFVACAVIVVMFFLDDTIYNEEYLLQTYDIPVLAKIPNLLTEEKDPYGYKKHYGAQVTRK